MGGGGREGLCVKVILPGSLNTHVMVLWAREELLVCCLGARSKN